MAIRIVEQKVPSSDGTHELWGRVYLPEGTPRGYFQVVHGMTEHIRRYDGFLRTLAERRYIAFGYDHLGHGYTARDEEELGFIAEKDGWKYLAADVGVYAEAVRAAYPVGGNIPYALMGHSMGSFVVRVAVSRGLRPDRLIVMGTGGPNPAAPLGQGIIQLVKAFRGGHQVSPMVNRLVLGGFNQRFRRENDPRAWLTKDIAHREKYAGDKYCMFQFTVSAMGDLVRLNRASNDRKWFRDMPKDLPILLVAGQDDPVGNYGRGVETVYRRLRRAGCQAELRLYPNCRHEILNDTCSAQVEADILTFLEPSQRDEIGNRETK